MKIKLDTDDADLEALIVHGQYIGRYKKLKSNKKFCNGLGILLSTLRSIDQLSELGCYQKFHFEALKHDLTGCYSARVYYSEPWRMILRDCGDSVSVVIVDVNYHYESN